MAGEQTTTTTPNQKLQQRQRSDLVPGSEGVLLNSPCLHVTSAIAARKPNSLGCRMQESARSASAPCQLVVKLRNGASSPLDSFFLILILVVKEGGRTALPHVFFTILATPVWPV